MSFFAALVPFRFAQVYRLDSPELFLEIRRYNDLSITKLYSVDGYGSEYKHLDSYMHC